MPLAPNSRRLVLLSVAGVLLIGIGVWQVAQLAEDRTLLRPHDFVEYWAAGRLLLDGQNPYDPDRLVPMQRTMNDGVQKAVMMWNPPWTLPLVLPFAALPWRAAQLIWLALQLACILVSVDWLWRIHGGPFRWRWAAWLIALTFAPTIFVLFIGQISGFILLGLAGFLYSMRHGRPTLAGCFAALTAIKPNLLALFALVLVLEASTQVAVRRAVLVGAGLIVAAAVIPVFWRANVWSDYFGAMRRPPSETFERMDQFEQATIGYALRIRLDGQPFAAQFIPIGVAAAVMLGIWLRCRNCWSWEASLRWLVLGSLLAAPYGAWAFDQVILLAAIIPAAVQLALARRHGLSIACAAAFLIGSGWLLLSLRESGSQANPWIAPVVLAACLLVERFAARDVRSPLIPRSHTRS